MTYLGSVSVLRESFSFVLKMQCEERGTTGMREAALFAKASIDGKVKISDDGKVIGEWNPDSAQYDTLFPDHPLSRLRRAFDGIKKTLIIAPEVKNAKPFPFPK